MTTRAISHSFPWSLILSISHLDNKLVPHPQDPVIPLVLHKKKSSSTPQKRKSGCSILSWISNCFFFFFNLQNSEMWMSLQDSQKYVVSFSPITVSDQLSPFSPELGLFCWNHHVILHALYPGIKYNPAVRLNVLH